MIRNANAENLIVMKLTPSWLKIVLVTIPCLVAVTAQGGVTLDRLASFTGGNGSKPWGALVQCPDGNFYGTTSFGGAHNSGTVFRMSAAGTITTLYSFQQNSGGAVPSAALTLGVDGFLYGTTRDAPPFFGTVFRITTNGLLTSLVRFTGRNGALPLSGALVQGRDLALYGLTLRGGSSDFGTAFRVTTSGALTTLHNFEYASGDGPHGGLIEAMDRNFYGVTLSGGPLAGGTIFRLTPVGVHTPLVALSYLGTNGMNPYSAPLQTRDGSFYGTTTQGGESYGDPRSVNRRGFGTIFKLTPGGAFTTLFSFHATNGSYPYARLIEGSDGDLYGTTISGGVYTNERSSGYTGYGTVFKISTNGHFTSLISFDGTNGTQPFASLMRGKDGNMYGATQLGGQFDLGTVYRLNLSLPPEVACPAAATVECGDAAELIVRVTSPDGDALSVVWFLNGESVQTNLVASSSPPVTADVSLSGKLPIGTNLVSVVVTDTATNSVSCSTTMAVLDTAPPVIHSTVVSPSVLWPPNHQMTPVSVTADATDSCGASTWRIANVECSEPTNGHGDGSTLPDWVITGDHTVNLRAERSGQGDERTYFIEIEAMDEAGNISDRTVVTVTVPASLGKRR